MDRTASNGSKCKQICVFVHKPDVASTEYRIYI